MSGHFVDLLRARHLAYRQFTVDARADLLRLRASSPERAADIDPYIEHADRLLAQDERKGDVMAETDLVLTFESRNGDCTVRARQDGKEWELHLGTVPLSEAFDVLILWQRLGLPAVSEVEGLRNHEASFAARASWEECLARMDLARMDLARMDLARMDVAAQKAAEKEK